MIEICEQDDGGCDHITIIDDIVDYDTVLKYAVEGKHGYMSWYSHAPNEPCHLVRISFDLAYDIIHTYTHNRYGDLTCEEFISKLFGL